MALKSFAAAVLVTTVFGHGTAIAQTSAIEQVNSLHWVRAPISAPIGNVAHLNLTNSLMALGESDTSTFIQLNGNPPTHGAYLVTVPGYQWFAIFGFDGTGYVKDDEKIDPDSLLVTLKEQSRVADEERRRLGLDPLTLEGWYVSPHYDVVTKRLEWGTKLRDKNNGIVVNYTSRILGRSGVMRATLVSQPETLDQDVASFHAAIRNFSFDAGQSYAEFRSGDKVAEYGLAALVVGGAAAVAVKGGSGFAKAIGLGAIGLLAAAWGAIKRIFARSEQTV